MNLSGKIALVLVGAGLATAGTFATRSVLAQASHVENAVTVASSNANSASPRR